MSTYTTTKYGILAPNGDEPLISSDNIIRAGADATDLALANMDGMYRLLASGNTLGPVSGLASGTTYVLTAAGALATVGAVGAESAHYLDPADVTSNSRSPKYRLRAALITNAVAPASTLTFGLYPVATWGGGSSAAPVVASIGSLVAGSTASFVAPASGGPAVSSSGDFTPPAAGHYVFGVAVTVATMAANSDIAVRLRLQARQV